MTPTDRYLDVLGLRRGVSKGELKAAYRALIRVSHPDRFYENEALKTQAEGRTKLLNEAYTYLTRNFEQIAHAAADPAAEPAPSEIRTGRARSADEKKRQDAEYRKRKAMREAAESLRSRRDAKDRHDRQTRVLGIAFVVMLVLYLLYARNHPANPGWAEAPAGAEAVEGGPE